MNISLGISQFVGVRYAESGHQVAAGDLSKKLVLGIRPLDIHPVLGLAPVGQLVQGRGGVVRERIETAHVRQDDSIFGWQIRSEFVAVVNAIRLALNVLRPFAEAGSIYDDYKTDEGFSDEQYEAMLAVLRADDPASKEGPWSVFYEAEGNVYRIGPFDNQQIAELAATKAQAEGEFDIHDQQVYLVGPITGCSC